MKSAGMETRMLGKIKTALIEAKITTQMRYEDLEMEDDVQQEREQLT